MSRMRLIDYLRLLNTIRLWLSKAQELLTLPDIEDPQAVYAWCRMILSLASQAVELTKTEVDDQIIDWLLSGPFATYEAFKPYYEVFRSVLQLLQSDESDEAIAQRAIEFGGSAAADALRANPLGLDPITLIGLIVQILRLILSLKGEKA